MRLAMLGWEFPPFISGGLGVHCYQLTKQLAQLGVQIDFYMPYTGNSPKVPWMDIIEVGAPTSPQEERVLGFGPYLDQIPFTNQADAGDEEEEVLQAPGSGENLFSSVRSYNQALFKKVCKLHELRHYDLIVAHDWITVEAAVAAKKETGLPMVLTIHSTELDRTANLNPFQWILGVEKQGVYSADKVITVSKRTAQRLEADLACNPSKVEVVYNAVDSRSFASKATRKEFGFKDGIVLFHGRLSVQKGPEFFLHAAKHVLDLGENAQFIVSGKGEMLPRLVEMAIDLGIADKVTFTGYLPDWQLADLYSVADAYVFPSVSEPFGITVLEAMASGTPVIMSKSSGVGEIVDHAFKVDFWDTHEMANKMVALLRYSALREELSENARQEVSQITWEKAAKQTLGVYSKAIGGANS